MHSRLDPLELSILWQMPLAKLQTPVPPVSLRLPSPMLRARRQEAWSRHLLMRSDRREPTP